MFELRPEEIKGCVCGGREGGKERDERTHCGASQATEKVRSLQMTAGNSTCSILRHERENGEK